MDKEEMLKYFDTSMEEVFKANSFSIIESLVSNIENNDVQDALAQLPDEIKILLVTKSLKHNSYTDREEETMTSWDEYYEMYDGKFDEKYMLHISILIEYENEILNLGYVLQDEKETWHKPESGEYKIDEENNIVIIHSCPDREIFEVEASQFVEDLGFKAEWISDVSFSTI